ncbi:Na+/H+ antiporter NhaC family protein [Paraburkholderia susongensis]|uniref:Na+/H+ antiporter NhaC-like C-terminal domain-containing protein n=1 Tax=Paraburkholderia susongensis TaxID=1515439 RepID=A0A1X7LJQ9_9BURK|nr:Na+/H+ antiporter NhaC family protein [Paraburkholderia susongensis]SMG53900.1 hypothetical protein SAMN06265784_106265 [Paraburkholderia susongensis]
MKNRWNSCGVYMTATLGVSMLNYAPFAVLCFVNPLLTIEIAYAGIQTPRLAASAAAPAAAPVPSDPDD